MGNIIPIESIYNVFPYLLLSLSKAKHLQRQSMIADLLHVRGSHIWQGLGFSVAPCILGSHR